MKTKTQIKARRDVIESLLKTALDKQKDAMKRAGDTHLAFSDPTVLELGRDVSWRKAELRTLDWILS